MTAPKTVVTSFSPAGYDRYGKRFVESFQAHWPRPVRLVIYFEPGQEEKPEGPDWWPIAEVAGLARFLEGIAHFPVMQGCVGENTYNIQTDARMARKAFMEAHAVATFGGKVFWIDADVVSHADVPEVFLDEALPDDKLCCYLGRKKMYTESGFLGFNAAHSLCASFLHNYVELFRSGIFVTLPAWHDCLAFDVVRRGFEEHQPGQFVDLGAGVDMGPGLNVFVNSRLGAYMDHLKGQRKGWERSPDGDLTVARTEPHWN